MEVEIERKSAPYQFESQSRGQSIAITAIPEMAGKDARGLRPMELILSALGSCLSIDVLNILYKQKQQVEHYAVKVRGQRSEGVPAVFTTINIHLNVAGNVHEEKLRKAIRMSEETYCSVHHMLNTTVDISTSYTLNDGQ